MIVQYKVQSGQQRNEAIGLKLNLCFAFTQHQQTQPTNIYIGCFTIPYLHSIAPEPELYFK